VNGLPRPDALLLDLDDTILSYGPVGEALWGELVRAFAPRLGVAVGRLDAALAEARGAYWSDAERARLGRLDLWRARREIVTDAFARIGVRASDAARELADTFTHEREERVTPLAGALEALDAWSAAGRPLALLTNGASVFQRRKIERFALARHFRVILVEGELGFGKPDRRVFERALRGLGVAPEQAWMVGDNLVADVQGAREAGVHTVWIDPRGRGVPEGAAVRPDAVVPALAELADRF
jgi:putative hydrolase of the HAD superfamily